MKTTTWKNKFDEKFAKIKEYSRGEYIISDATGTKFVAHCDDTGKVISAGGLESVKDFIEILLHEQKQEITKEIRLAFNSMVVDFIKENEGKGLVFPESYNYIYDLLIKNNMQDIITLIENENTDFPVRESDEFDEGGRMFKQALLSKLNNMKITLISIALITFGVLLHITTMLISDTFQAGWIAGIIFGIFSNLSYSLK